MVIEMNKTQDMIDDSKKQLVRNYIMLIADSVVIVFILWLATTYPSLPSQWFLQMVHICLAVLIAMFAIKLLKVTIKLKKMREELIALH